MSDFERKKLLALQELSRSGISPRNCVPPAFGFLWRRGVEIPPPHYMKTLPLFLVMGLPFGVCALGIYLMRADDRSAVELALAVWVVTTSVFGISITLYYRATGARARLSRWSKL